MIVKNNYTIQEDQQRVVVKPIPKNPLRITGSRLGKVLGMSHYSTPFQQWCVIQRFYKSKPESKEIEAGNQIEPTLREYLKQLYTPLHCQVIDPIYCFKPDDFEYFPKEKIFGGKWDALL